MIMSIEQLNELLKDQLEAWLPEIIGGASDARGKLWYAARTADGGIGDSLTVRLQDDRRGQWRHHPAGRGGDELGLIAYARFNDNMKEAYAWARHRLGLDAGAGAAPPVPSDEEMAKRRAERARLAALRQAELEKLRGRADAIWQGATPRFGETPLDFYFKDRGIDLRRLPEVPGALRYAPQLWHSGLQKKLPAMVARCIFGNGRFATIHRTYLVQRRRPDGSTFWDRVREKIDGHNGKLVYCDYSGAAIPLWRGERVDAKTGEIKRGHRYVEAPAGSSIDIPEGIESGLALALLKPERRVAAGVALDNIAVIDLPRAYADVTWWRENDVKPAAIEAAERVKWALANHLAARGARLKVARLPERFNDLGDVIKGAA